MLGGSATLPANVLFFIGLELIRCVQSACDDQTVLPKAAISTPAAAFGVKLLLPFEVDIKVTVRGGVTLQTQLCRDFTEKERALIARAEGLICYPSAVADVSYFHANVRQFST